MGKNSGVKDSEEVIIEPWSGYPLRFNIASILSFVLLVIYFFDVEGALR